MSRTTFLVAAVLAAFLANVNAECANACNGHGKCVGYDMCICNRNWQANDCSERVCMHGLAHVDTPKGDLDMSGDVIQPGTKVVADNSFQYPYGTTEQFPQMEDSDLSELTNSAHYYMECSNKGTCDRSSGECECFDGYDGVACQRASCPGYPNSCSGHGVCKSAKQLAEADNGNIYKLWNKDSTMGCECDSGYYGADCSEKNCKVGVDPLYLDDSSTIRYSVYDFATLTTAATADFDDGHPTQGKGYWAIRFFDHTGEDWVTSPIVAGATCAAVKTALYDIPNDVIPAGTLYCSRTARADRAMESSETAYGDVGEGGWNSGMDHSGSNDAHNNTRINYRMSIWDAYIYNTAGIKSQGDPLSKNTENGNNIYSPLMWAPGSFTTEADAAGTGTGVGRGAGGHAHLSGYIYRLKFYGNPGKLQQPEIITHLDGKRNSLMSTTFNVGNSQPQITNAVITKVWTDGRNGEDVDYFADHCDGVTVSIKTDALTSGLADKNNVDNTKVYELITGGVNANGNDAAQTALLKKCLGDSDATSTNNVGIYDWDEGDIDYPHLVKLVRTVTTYTDGGYYVAIIWNNSKFNMLNPFVPPDAVMSDTYEVYTTKGTLSRVSRLAQAHFGFGQKSVYTTHTAKADANAGKQENWDGDLSCEVGDNNGFRVTPSVYTQQLTSVAQHGAITTLGALISNAADNGDAADVFINDVVTEWTYDYSVQPSKRKATAFYKNCVNKTDIITFINSNVNLNAPNMNLYTVERLVKDKSTWSNSKRYGAGTGVIGAAGAMSDTPDQAEYDAARGMEFGTNVINIDIATNWGTDIGKDHTADSTVLNTSPYYVYKFVPHADSNYQYVAECANRGICDGESGVCECFPGYTNDNCDTQSSIAL